MACLFDDWGLDFHIAVFGKNSVHRILPSCGGICAVKQKKLSLGFYEIPLVFPKAFRKFTEDFVYFRLKAEFFLYKFIVCFYNFIRFNVKSLACGTYFVNNSLDGIFVVGTNSKKFPVCSECRNI